MIMRHYYPAPILTSMVCYWLCLLGNYQPQVGVASAFVVPFQQGLSCRSTTTTTTTTTTRFTQLFLEKGWLAPEEHGNENNHHHHNNNKNNSTNHINQDATVQRKRKHKSGYKPLDNRDQLPFCVKTVTPDPYTHPQIKKARTLSTLSTKTSTSTSTTPSRVLLQNNNNNNNKSNKKNKKKSKKISKQKQQQQQQQQADTSTILGEFALDQSTTSGDIICIDGLRQYRVETARCQYKYVGGAVGRFVMVRKILEVKEITRILQEEALTRQFYNDDDDGTVPLELE